MRMHVRGCRASAALAGLGRVRAAEVVEGETISGFNWQDLENDRRSLVGMGNGESKGE